MTKFLSVFLVLCSIFVVSCGFEPMYATKSFGGKNISSKLSQVAVANIPNRNGQFLRNLLYDRFYIDGKPANPKYTLSVKEPEEIQRDLDITVGAEATRSQLEVFTTFQLTDVQSGKILLSDRVESIASFNIVANEYATRVSESATRENALRDIARQIEQKITLKLNALD